MINCVRYFSYIGYRLFFRLVAINRYFYVESEYNNFLLQINSSKVIQPQSYFFLFNTEETQTLIIPIFCLLFMQI